MRAEPASVLGQKNLLACFPIKRFVIDRLARLYVVLIPALIITFLSSFSGVCEAGDFKDWLGTLFFLQNVIVPVTSCNDPLWSLSNEFWYYLVSFLLALSLRKIVLGFVLLFVLLSLFGDGFSSHNVILYAPMWAIGVVVFMPFRISVSPLLAFGAFALSVAASRSHGLDGVYWFRDAFIAICLSFYLMAFMQRAEKKLNPVPMAALAKTMAAFSFTIYIVHWPLMRMFIHFIGETHQLPLDPSQFSSYLWLALVVGTIVGVSYLLSRITEAQTWRVRKALYRMVGGVEVCSPVQA